MRCALSVPFLVPSSPLYAIVEVDKKVNLLSPKSGGTPESVQVYYSWSLFPSKGSRVDARYKSRLSFPSQRHPVVPNEGPYAGREMAFVSFLNFALSPFHSITIRTTLLVRISREHVIFLKSTK